MTPPGWYFSIIAAPVAAVVPRTVGMNSWPTFSAVLIRRTSDVTGSGVGVGAALGVVRPPAAVRRADPSSEPAADPPHPAADATAAITATAETSRGPPIRLIAVLP
ncbi:hypothetical protein GCM10010151_28990 [Actinoallomurus spadix]|uniref:Secreted protein n=1 Tax=Actinoallomurus spadix TaxID=79912 RepID=A0ABN0WH26_9ACTN